jgi:hypothetical protein
VETPAEMRGGRREGEGDRHQVNERKGKVLEMLLFLQESSLVLHVSSFSSPSLLFFSLY